MTEAKQFDIRLTVDEFKASVGSYLSWKPGMDINVTHIKRRDILAFVFPGGIRPSRPARVSVGRRPVPETSVASSVSMDTGTSADFNVVDGPNDSKKRKWEEDHVLTKIADSKLIINEGLENKRFCVGNPSSVTSSLAGVEGIGEQVGTSGNNNEMSQNNDDISVPITSISRDAEKLAIEKLMSGPY